MESVPTSGRNERLTVLFLCLLGAAHVFIYSAAFPFFNATDEASHFDLVMRYSRGDLPRTLTPMSAEALPMIAIYGTPEYLCPPASFPGGKIPPPPWKQRPETVRQELRAKEKFYQEIFHNQEAASPPLYYGLAGAWWRLGRLLRLEGGQLLYWLRFLNVTLMVALVWLGSRAARDIFPENRFIRLTVPALIACLPQCVFYGLNNDVLSPLAFGAAFVLVLRVWDATRLTPGLAAGAGLALAAAFLTKTSNLPLLAAAMLLLVVKTRRLARNGTWRTWAFPLLILGLTAALPMAAWMAWCKINFGDFTGSNLKIQFLGWTHQPLAAWLNHPIFEVPGCWYFISHNLSTFWQGELTWRRQSPALPVVDLVYVVLTLGAFGFVAAGCLRRPSPFTPPQRAALGFGFLCVAAAFAFFALLSMAYDFQNCFYPSREQPFFVSGRLMLGMLVPFLMLFACGLDRLTRRFSPAARLGVLLVLLAFMLTSELKIDWPLFGNEYNWFHL